MSDFSYVARHADRLPLLGHRAIDAGSNVRNALRTLDELGEGIVRASTRRPDRTTPEEIAERTERALADPKLTSILAMVRTADDILENEASYVRSIPTSSDVRSEFQTNKSSVDAAAKLINTRPSSLEDLIQLRKSLLPAENLALLSGKADRALDDIRRGFQFLALDEHREPVQTMSDAKLGRISRNLTAASAQARAALDLIWEATAIVDANTTTEQKQYGTSARTVLPSTVFESWGLRSLVEQARDVIYPRDTPSKIVPLPPLADAASYRNKAVAAMNEFIPSSSDRNRFFQQERVTLDEIRYGLGDVEHAVKALLSEAQDEARQAQVIKSFGRRAPKDA